MYVKEIFSSGQEVFYGSILKSDNVLLAAFAMETFLGGRA